MTVRSSHHDDVASNAAQADDAVNRRPLNGRFPFDLQTNFHKECDGSAEVFDDDADIVHSQQRGFLRSLGHSLQGNAYAMFRQ